MAKHFTQVYNWRNPCHLSYDKEFVSKEGTSDSLKGDI